MGCSTMTALFLVIGTYILMQYQSAANAHAVSPPAGAGNEAVSSGTNINLGPSQRTRGHSLILAPRMPGVSQYIRARLTPVEPAGDSLNDFIIDDEDISDVNKRQSDDYGHMRFGKRDPFDDYGHMRFGRSPE